LFFCRSLFFISCYNIFFILIIDEFLFLFFNLYIDSLGTIDYVDPKRNAIDLRIHPSEKGKLVFQMGTANADLALKAAMKMYLNPNSVSSSFF